jgi:hypothetical protein
MYRAAEALADSLAALDRRSEAIEVLERVLSRRERETLAGTPLGIIRCRQRLEALRAGGG